MIQLTRRQTVATMTGLGLLTAGLSFGDSALRFFAPAGSEIPSEADDGKPTVVHNVEHRSGTQAVDVLTGEDDFIITPRKIAGGEFVSNYPDELSHNLDDYMVEDCEPKEYRIHNATDEYIEGVMGIPNSGVSWEIGIGPGERYQSPALEAGIWFFQVDGHFKEVFPVHSC